MKRGRGSGSSPLNGSPRRSSSSSRPMKEGDDELSQSFSGDDSSADNSSEVELPDVVKVFNRGSIVCTLNVRAIQNYSDTALAQMISKRQHKVLESPTASIKITIEVTDYEEGNIKVTGVDKKMLKEVLDYYKNGVPVTLPDTTDRRSEIFQYVCESFRIPVQLAKATRPIQTTSGSGSTIDSIHAPPMREKEADSPIPINLLAIVPIVIALLAVLYYSVGEDMHIEESGAACNRSDTPADVIKDRLMTDIPEQGKPFWTRLKSNIRSISRPNSRPACMLVALNSSQPSVSKSSLRCVTNHVECALSGHRNSLELDATGKQGMAARSSLEASLNSYFDSRNKVVIINNIDSMDVEVAKIFYKFCDDNDQPAYPSTMLILTVEHSEPDKVDDRWISERLHQQWSSDPDELDPLLARMAVSITWLNSNTQSELTCKV